MKRAMQLLGTAIISLQLVLCFAVVQVIAGGLPQWIERDWVDFPIEIRLNSRADLESLRGKEGIEIHREDIALTRSVFGEEEIVVRTRVTDALFDVLVSDGYLPGRVRDDVRIGFEDAIDTWKTQLAVGGELWRTGADLDGRDGERAYHSISQIAQLLNDAESDHSSIAETFSIGMSVQGRDLIGLHISDNVSGAEEAEPEVRITSTMHGNEPPGMEMMLYLIEYLTDNYPADPVVQNLVDNYDIWILPLHNPDGYAAADRENAHNVDLNRNFPVPDGSIGDDNTYTQEPETSQFISSFGRNERFVIALDFHSGALVANYPWDYIGAPAPDKAAIKQVCLEYTTYNLPMYNGNWYQGMVNGYYWYPTEGSIQDWSYHETDCYHVILEVSGTHWPNSSQLPGLWDDNRESLLHWIKSARYGINGVVTDAVTGLPVDATVSIAGNTKPVDTDPDVGDYYKIVDTGTYSITVSANGYTPQTIDDIAVVWGTPSVVDVALVPITVSAPELTTLGQPSLEVWPLPSGSATFIAFSVPAEVGTFELSVIDARGRLIRRLPGSSTAQAAGIVNWDGRDDRGRPVSAGVYFCRLSLDDRPPLSSRIVIAK